MSNGVAMVDIDGVLYPYTDRKFGCYYDIGAFAEVVSRLLQRRRTSLPVAKVWNFPHDQWAMSDEEFQYCMREGTLRHNLFNRKYPIEAEAAAHLAKLHALGVEIHFVTNRAIDGAVEEATDQTRLWLATHGFEYDRLVVSKEKVANGPGGYQWALDDNEGNYDKLEAASCNPYLLTRPWNADHPGRRVASVEEFVGMIERELHA